MAKDSLAEKSKVYLVPVTAIKLSDENVRQHQQDKELDDLVQSIEKHGLLQPVLLKGSPTDGPPFELIVGQRRYLAHRRLGRKDIPAVFGGPLNDIQAKIRSLAENMHRVQLTYEDAADAVTFLYTKLGRNDRKVAAETGMSLKKVRQYIYIEKIASEETKKKLHSGKVTPADAQRALRAAGGDSAKADHLLQLMEKHKLTTYEKKRMVEHGSAHPQASIEDLLTEAKRVKVEPSIVVNLSGPERQALEQAAGKLRASEEEVAVQAISDWLRDKGFLS